MKILLPFVLILFLTSCKTSVSSEKEIETFLLTNENGMEMKVTNFGGRVMELKVKNKEGNLTDVVQGFNQPEDYIIFGNTYFGAAIGRYANRIAQGRFSIEDSTYQLTPNNGPNSLHGGEKGFHNIIWEVLEHDQSRIVFQHFSKDGEEGFPGNLTLIMTYELTENNEFKITYSAQTDKATPINLSHHSFFNLNGFESTQIGDHILQINASYFTPVDSLMIPTGEIKSVAETVFDFTSGKAIAEGIDAEDEQLKFAQGFDHNWVIDNYQNGELNLAAKVYAPNSGIQMEVFTTQPGIQFYSGNFLNGKFKGKNEVPFIYRSAFCLETQHFPNSPNQSNFPSTILVPEETYKQISIYRFSVK